MNCSTCKNPIKDNVTECEWCGATIAVTNNNINQQSDFEFNAQNVFHIAGRGRVIKGTLNNGQIEIGDKLKFTISTEFFFEEVIGIFAYNQLIKSYSEKGTIGILIASKGKNSIADESILNSKIKKV